MRKHADTLSDFIKSNKMQLLLLSLSTLITIANLWIASLLTPVKGDINRVEAIAIENRKILEKSQPRIEVVDVINSRLEDICNRLERIENRLDRL